MDNLERMRELREVYLSLLDKKGFLEGIISYCSHLKFTPEGTRMMLGMTVGIVPLPGEDFSRCRSLSGEENNIYNSVLSEMDKKNG